MAARKPPNTLKIGFWHAVRDIFVTSINKGQFPLAILGAIVLVALAKMPAEGLRDIGQSVVQKLEQGSLVGWALWLLTACAWAFIGRRSRRYHVAEVQRIGKEKSDLHRKLLGSDASSSES